MHCGNKGLTSSCTPFLTQVGCEWDLLPDGRGMVTCPPKVRDIRGTWWLVVGGRPPRQEVWVGRTIHSGRADQLPASPPKVSLDNQKAYNEANQKKKKKKKKKKTVSRVRAHASYTCLGISPYRWEIYEWIAHWHCLYIHAYITKSCVNLQRKFWYMHKLLNCNFLPNSGTPYKSS